MVTYERVQHLNHLAACWSLSSIFISFGIWGTYAHTPGMFLKLPEPELEHVWSATWDPDALTTRLWASSKARFFSKVFNLLCHPITSKWVIFFSNYTMQ